MSHDPELHDPLLAERLRALDSGLNTPDAWVRDALGVPSRHAVVAEREPSWLVAFMPHVIGIALLVGLAVAAYFNRDLLNNFAGTLPVRAPSTEFDTRFLLVGMPALGALGYLLWGQARRLLD